MTTKSILTARRTTTTTSTPTGPALPGVQQLSAVSWDGIGTGDSLLVVTAVEVTGLEVG